MVESLMETMEQGEKEDFRTRPVEPENTVGMKLALPHCGKPHKEKIVEHKKDGKGDDLLVAEFHTGARDVFTYQDILDALKDEKNMQEEAYFTFEEILDHKPLKEGTPLDKAKQWIAQVRWNQQEKPTWEPLSALRRDDPITLASYAHEKVLTKYDG